MEVRRENSRRDSESWAATAVRLAVGAIGVFALLVGLRAAWRSDSATAPLVVGAVLLVLALVFTRDLEELSGRWKDTSVTLRRSPSVALSHIALELESVATPPGDGDGSSSEEGELSTVRQRVRAIAAEAALAADEAALAERYPELGGFPAASRAQSWRLMLGGAVRRGHFYDKPAVGYGFNSYGEGGPRVLAHVRWLGDWVMFCRVTSPAGTTPTKILFGSPHMQAMNFHVSYPDDFAGAPALEPGEYKFTWIRAFDTGSGWNEDREMARDYVRITEEMLASGEAAHPEVRHEDPRA